jgi:hypothetical protein
MVAATQALGKSIPRGMSLPQGLILNVLTNMQGEPIKGKSECRARPLMA